MSHSVWFGVLVFLCIAMVLGLLLGWAAQKFRLDNNPMLEKINEILPQTQCGQCNYPGCRPYAEAISHGEADINQCPPGGQAGVDALAKLLGLESKPLNATHGIEKPKQIALIDESVCIGCTKCIQACPVDAILGAQKMMHSIIDTECTGCELCIPPCPVDCITMIPAPANIAAWKISSTIVAKEKRKSAHR